MPSPGSAPLSAPVLNPRDVIQVAFLLEEQLAGNDDSVTTSASDNKKLLGQLAIQWRTAMGDRGSLSTGWLTSKR
jgi:hypothetical protein